MRCLFLTTFLLFVNRFVNSENPFNCRTTCPTRDVSPVCGTDLKTYASRCHLQQAKCRGHKVRMIYRDRCRVSQGRSQCVEERQKTVLAIKKRELLEFGVFIPRCDPDGSFTRIQCLKASSVCWCVDSQGKEVAGTRTRQRKPTCPSTPPPRSSNKSPWKLRRHNYKGCPKNVRITFSKKVITFLERQFVSYMGKSSSVSLQGIQGNFGISKLHILMWKFNQLDTNADYFLEWRELHEFLRSTKKNIYPKKCSKTFVAYCDENSDNRVSRNEWYECFGVKEIKKCIGEYLTAVKSSGNHFIPKCQSDGSYVPTQCHPAIGYCWCADVDTGKPIPGSQQKSTSLDCRRYASRRVGSSSRKKGGKKECTREILPTFIHQLLQVFRKELSVTWIDDRPMVGQLDESLIRIQRQARSGNLGAWGIFLSDNQVLAWKFHQLDTNNNRLLTTAEYFIPAMRKTLGRVKRGRRCSRKLLNDCDYDKNGGLSVDEWSYCILVGLNKFLR